MISLLLMQSFTFTYLSNDHSHLLLSIPACWKFFINILYMKVLTTRWPPQLNMWSSCSRGRATRLQETQSVRFVWIEKKISVQFIWCLSFIGDHWRVGDHRWWSWLLRNGFGHHRGEMWSPMNTQNGNITWNINSVPGYHLCRVQIEHKEVPCTGHV